MPQNTMKRGIFHLQNRNGLFTCKVVFRNSTHFHILGLLLFTSANCCEIEIYHFLGKRIFGTNVQANI